MSASSSPQPTATGRWVAKACDYAVHYAVEIFLIALILYFCISRGLTLSIDVYDPLPAGQSPEVTTEASLDGRSLLQSVSAATSGLAVGASGLWTTLTQPTVTESSTPHPPTGQNPKRNPAARLASETTVAIDSKFSGFNEVAPTADPAPHISNLTLVLSPDYGRRKNLPAKIIAAKKARVQNYLDRYAPLARREMAEYGIPASITLAQGLLESNAGDSKLAVNSKNHFGIKCRKKCLGCTCRNYGDDTRYDMFRVFDSVAASYREHSKLLNSPRYVKLKGHGTNYVKWAHGLKACGYATDKKYGHKLVKIIENLGLDKYDRVG